MILRRIKVQFEHDFSVTVIFGSKGHGSGCLANGLIPYRLGRSESGFRVEIFTTVIDRLLYIELEVYKFDLWVAQACVSTRHPLAPRPFNSQVIPGRAAGAEPGVGAGPGPDLPSKAAPPTPDSTYRRPAGLGQCHWHSAGVSSDSDTASRRQFLENGCWCPGKASP